MVQNYGLFVSRSTPVGLVAERLAVGQTTVLIRPVPHDCVLGAYKKLGYGSDLSSWLLATKVSIFLRVA